MVSVETAEAAVCSLAWEILRQHFGLKSRKAGEHIPRGQGPWKSALKDSMHRSPAGISPSWVEMWDKPRGSCHQAFNLGLMPAVTHSQNSRS